MVKFDSSYPRGVHEKEFTTVTHHDGCVQLTCYRGSVQIFQISFDPQSADQHGFDLMHAGRKEAGYAK